ncbi:MAG TPA: helix-turn-helix domain-containing protein, partial [Opitutaceae bacterium]|nr:helix-turn-helix domain-containing protein [Opitutaceae bacterium]
KATVSLALRNHPKIPEVTRQRLQRLAESLGYRPDPALARIAAHRWKTRDHPSEFVIAFVSCSHPWSPHLEVSA